MLEIKTMHYITLTIALAIAFGSIGALLIGLSYRQRKQPVRRGMAVGAVLGSSIIFLIMGAIGIAASNADMTTTRLVGISMVGLGLVLYVFLIVSRPRQENQSLLNIAYLINALRQPPPAANAPATTSSAAPSEKQPMKVFISYRRDDSPDVTGRIYDVLVQRYGTKSVFKDVDSIPFGVDFRKHLQGVIEKCDVVLVIIGDRWLNVMDTQGTPRINDQADFVRIEIESALQRDIYTVPVLVKGSPMPTEDKLPQSIKDLAFRNGLSVRYDPDFHHDMERLIRSLDENFSRMS